MGEMDRLEWLKRNQIYTPPAPDYVREEIIERELERQDKWALIRVALWLMSAAIVGFLVGWSLPW